MPINCVIIDDEPLAVELLKAYTLRFPELLVVKTFTDAVEALEYLQTSATDMLFVDINMPDISGLELVRHLSVTPMIVFTTAYKQFAVDAYDLDALDYLLKPIEQDRFAKAVQKAVEYYGYKHASAKAHMDVLYVRSEYQLVKINVGQIEYIESAEDYVKIHLTAGRPVMTLMTLKGILEKLPPQQFRRVHRSYIIPVLKIISINNRKIKLSGAEIPIGDNYLEIVQDLVKRK